MVAAVRLIQVLGHELRVTDEGKSLLQSDAFNDSSPLLVVSIAGPARTGKSTLLNCILKRFGQALPAADDGFSVGHTTDDTTDGVWLWPEPIVINGKQQRLVLLDIEGCDSMQKNAEVTNGLYCLSYTVSSLMMWNLQGRLNESFRTDLVKLANATSIIMPTEDERSSVNESFSSLASKLKRGFGKLTISKKPDAKRHDHGSYGIVVDSSNNHERDQQPAAVTIEEQKDEEESVPGHESAKRQADQMLAVGKDGPCLLVLVRDFALGLGSKTTPSQYLDSELKVNDFLSAEQRLGALVAQTLFKSKDIILFPVPPKGVAREDFGTLSDDQLGPSLVSALQGLMRTLASTQPRDVLQLSEGPAGYLKGKLLCNFICQLVEQINAKGMLELGVLGWRAVDDTNRVLLHDNEAAFDKLAALKLQEFASDYKLASPEGLAEFRIILQNEVEEMRATFKPSGPMDIQGEHRKLLQQCLKDRLHVWDTRAYQRHCSMLAKEVSVYTTRVEAESRAVAIQHLPTPATTIIADNEAERIWDKIVEPTVHNYLRGDKLYANSKEEVQVILRQLRSNVLERQKQENMRLAEQAAMHSCMIKGTDARKLVVHLDREGYVRGAPSTEDNLPNLRNLFLTGTGGVLARLPMKDDEVAIYSVADKAVWKAELVGKTFWGNPKYVLRRMPWQLGDVSLPAECLFQVHAKGNDIMLHSSGRGFVIRKYPPSTLMKDAFYRLGRADLSSRFKLVTKPMSFGEKTVFEAAVRMAVKLPIEVATLGLVHSPTIGREWSKVGAS